LTFWITGAGVDLMPVAFVGIFIPYGCGADGAEILEGADGAGGVNDMPADLAGGGAPMPDRDGGGADTLAGAGGAPMPDKDGGGLVLAGAAGAAMPRLLVAAAGAAVAALAAACPLSLAPPPDGVDAFEGPEVVFDGEDFAAACPLSLPPPPEEALFDVDDFAAA
jgi:hypothetical protein